MWHVWGRSGAYRVLVGKPKKGGYMEGTGLNGKIILNKICEKKDGGMDWIDLAQDRDKWRAVVNAVMNLQVP